MFTGIIQSVGTVQKAEIKKEGILLTVQAPKLFSKIKKGASIAVNGVCLTVTKKNLKEKTFLVDVMPETIKKSNLGNLKKNSLVNLEQSLGAQDLIDGHFVLGHVDTTGKVTEISPSGNSYLLKIQASNPLYYIAKKGSVALNGISLTVIDFTSQSFRVGIIPYTWKNTMLHSLRVGDRVNIEFDILAKYIKRIIKGASSK